MKIASYFSKSGKGSILLELAVGISVLAVISGFVIRKTMSATKGMQAQITKVNIDTIVVSLASFVANNNRLPRPAENGTGVEGSANIKCGYVPYKTLGISEKIAKDGTGKLLIYAVEPILTQNFERIYWDEFAAPCFCQEIIYPQIKINQNSSKNVIAFVIDTQKPEISDRDIKIHPTANTTWISRDMLLMKYLKNSPCVRENVREKTQADEFVEDI